MKLILLGTSDFSCTIFEQIIKKYEVICLISQPNKPSKRGMQINDVPMKILSQKYNIPIFQPEKIGDIYEQLSKLDFDFMLTAAYGQYIPKKILNLPKIAALNIHGSLLPKYRGAAPIQYALLNGENQTGLSFIYMVQKMDQGDILKTVTLNISPFDDSGILFEKLAILGSKYINIWLQEIYENNFIALRQDDLQATLAPKLKKEDAYIPLDTNLDSEFIINKVRAFSPNPGSFTFLENQRVKLFFLSKIFHKQALKIEFNNFNLYAYKYQFESKKIVNLMNLLTKN